MKRGSREGQSHKVTVWSPQGIDNILREFSGNPENPDLKDSDLESRQLSQNMPHIGSVQRQVCGQQRTHLPRGSGPKST